MTLVGSSAQMVLTCVFALQCELLGSSSNYYRLLVLLCVERFKYRETTVTTIIQWRDVALLAQSCSRFIKGTCEH